MTIDPNSTAEYALEKAIAAIDTTPWEGRADASRSDAKAHARVLVTTGWFSGGQITAITGAPTHVVRHLARGRNPKKLGGAIDPSGLSDLVALRKAALSPDARDRYGRWNDDIRALATKIVGGGTSPGTVDRFTGIPAKRIEIWVKAAS